jgi:hypothetical protein
MRGLKVNLLSRDVERTGRFEIFSKIGSARADRALLQGLDRIFREFSRGEADRVTRRWYATMRAGGTSTSELANVTLAYYERTLRRLRPYYELDFDRRRERRTVRYRGVDAFLEWLSRQGKIRFRSLKISYISPSVNVLVQFRNSMTVERSYLWAAGNEQGATERLFAKLDAALSQSAGKRPALRSRQANATYAGLCALSCASAVALYLHGRPVPAVIGAAALADVALALGLMFLFRLAWPQIAFRFEGAGAGGAVVTALYRILYLGAAAALSLGGAWVILSSFVRFVW